MTLSLNLLTYLFIFYSGRRHRVEVSAPFLFVSQNGVATFLTRLAFSLWTLRSKNLHLDFLFDVSVHVRTKPDLVGAWFQNHPTVTRGDLTESPGSDIFYLCGGGRAKCHRCGK